MTFRIGLISDTHGLLRPEACEALCGCDAILHAGDIGKPEILEALARIAPVTAVRGNNDTGAWAGRIPKTATLMFAGTRVHVLHQIQHLAPDPHGAGIRVVVYGHSHKPLVEQRDGVLYVNPGSAGRRRFRLPVTVAELVCASDQAPRARIIPLDVAPR